uniref:Uncharacterized protein n=1 Tax=Oryza glumipatula TaxID=40148 RepID=A0A0E0BES6_9ORYZ
MWAKQPNAQTFLTSSRSQLTATSHRRLLARPPPPPPRIEPPLSLPGRATTIASYPHRVATTASSQRRAAAAAAAALWLGRHHHLLSTLSRCRLTGMPSSPPHSHRVAAAASKLPARAAFKPPLGRHLTPSLPLPPSLLTSATAAVPSPCVGHLLLVGGRGLRRGATC